MQKEKVNKILFSKGDMGRVINKVSIPAKWISKLGVTAENPKVKLILDEEKITIEKNK